MKAMIVRANLAEQVYDHIKRMILSGELKAGERISEASLSQMFGVSRTPLREALKKLNEYGLILLKPRSYAEVVTISEREAHQIAEVRLNLESMAVRLFMENASGEDFSVLVATAKKCQDAIESRNKAKTFEEDSKFHKKIFELCGNEILYSLYEKIDARIQLYRINQCQDLDTIADYVRQHKRIIDSMQRGEQKLLSSMLAKHIFRDARF